MKKKNKKMLILGIILLVIFMLWTALVSFIDVREIGPNGSLVGFATLNGYVHKFIGVNWIFYVITDWLGIVPIVVALGFAILGLVQFIRRKSIFKVDRSILILGVFYLFIISIYVFFEVIIINFRPTLIDGKLEASYPSSTTMLAMFVMPTAAMQLNVYIKNTHIKCFVIIAIVAFTAFMVIGRVISGVHWITDIIGGAFLSIGLVLLYFYYIINMQIKKCKF